MKKSNFDRLLERYLTGQVSEAERIKMEAWLDVMKTEEGSDLELDDADEEKLFQKITSNIGNVEEIFAFRPHESKTQTSLLTGRWLQYAAVFMLLVAVSYTTWYFINNISTSQEVIAKDDIEKIILDDGTIVWLHKDSKLAYKKGGAGDRQVMLAGEALFEVAKDPGNPFTISCGAVIVKVLGTSFSLKATDERIELKVLTGKVHLSSAINKTGVEVAPNEKVIYSTEGLIERIMLEKEDLLAITARTEYDMHFTNTSMALVAAKIEKKFNVGLVIENKQLNTCRITADFTDHSLDTTLKMISELLEIGYTINGNTVVITGKGCH